jgi:hypothetical protein
MTLNHRLAVLALAAGVFFLLGFRVIGPIVERFVQ